jgi:hypothetical protein
VGGAGKEDRSDHGRCNVVDFHLGNPVKTPAMFAPTFGLATRESRCRRQSALGTRQSEVWFSTFTKTR